MPYRYRYTHSAPTAFTSIQHPNGGTWVPNEGDEITLDYAVAHPHLELVTSKKSTSPVVELADAWDDAFPADGDVDDDVDDPDTDDDYTPVTPLATA